MTDTLREALEKCAEWNHLHGGWSSEMERIVRAALATPETAASETDYPAHWPREVRDACQDAAQQAPEDRSFFARTIKYLSDECLQLRAECDREIQRAIEDTFRQEGVLSCHLQERKWEADCQCPVCHVTRTLIAEARMNAAAEMRERCAEIINRSPTLAKHSSMDKLCWCEICTYARGNVSEIRALPLDAQDDAWLRVHDQKIAGIVLRESAKAIRAVFSICGRSEDWESGSLDGRAKCAALLETLVDVDWSSILTEAAKERT